MSFSSMSRGVLAAVVVLAATSQLSVAATINAGNLPNSGDTVNLGFATVNTFNGTFGQRTIGSITGVGVNTGSVNEEIDGSEAMVITYNSAVLMNELSLAFLYPTPQYGDASNEIAKVTFNDLFTYTLTADTTLTATWTGPGSVTNIEAAVEGFGGAWRISNPFGNNLVTSIRLESGNPGDNNTFGDFALFSATSSAVPEPGTYALLGTGLATLIAFARRRQK